MEVLNTEISEHKLIVSANNLLALVLVAGASFSLFHLLPRKNRFALVHHPYGCSPVLQKGSFSEYELSSAQLSFVLPF